MSDRHHQRQANKLRFEETDLVVAEAPPLRPAITSTPVSRTIVSNPIENPCTIKTARDNDRDPN
jgi:hypothetical protein